MGLSFFLYLAVLLGLIGFSVFWPAWKARKQDQMLDAWPTESGSVIAVDFEKVPEENGQAGGGREWFQVSVRYQFRAMGQMRFGNTIAPQRRVYSAEEKQQLQERYTPGSSVRVFYNPSDPMVSYLEKPRSTNRRNIAIGIAIFGFAALSVILALLGF